MQAFANIFENFAASIFSSTAKLTELSKSDAIHCAYLRLAQGFAKNSAPFRRISILQKLTKGSTILRLSYQTEDRH